MPVDLYPLSVGVFLRGLAALDTLLDKAASYATERKIEPATLLTARLFPDMFPLKQQIQVACDTAKRSTARLSGVEAPTFEDSETNFEELHARIRKTTDFLAGVKAEAFVGADERKVEQKMSGAVISLTGLEYLTRFALPNFYFHVATAYGICRHNGVVVGKKDFLGSLSS